MRIASIVSTLIATSLVLGPTSCAGHPSTDHAPLAERTRTTHPS